jgi:hypothetical protein
MRNSEEIVYSLNVEDIQTVAEDDFSRQLTEAELQSVIQKLPDYIDWWEAISLSIMDVFDTAEPGSSDEGPP